MITAQFTGDRIISNSMEAFSLYEKSCLGEKKEGKIEYSLAEALFLISEKRLTVYAGKKLLPFDELMKKLKRIDKKIETKFIVFRNLRKKGYILKTALKYGADFRIYSKGIKPGENHARWILFCTRENEALTWHDFAAKNRIAHSIKKNLLIAIVDEESDVSYYEITWLKP
jgi:tRNA-intron endonuclease